jgi:hypothetical protein
MPLRSSSFFVALLCFVMARPASAEGPMLDTVETRGGGLLRGSVAENLPGDHVTLVLPNGEVRVVPWSDVDKVILGAPEAAPAAPAYAVPFEGPTATIHIESPKPVVLDRKPHGHEAWVLACESPCDRPMPIGDLYRVVGTGIMSTPNFTLEAKPGARHVVRVRTASKRAFEWGRGMTFTGLFIDFYGALVAAAGWASAARSCGPDSPNSVYLTPDASYTACRGDVQHSRETRNGGLVALGIGAVLTAAGALLYLSNLESKIDQAPVTPKDPSAREAPPPIVAAVHAPGELSMPVVDLRF